jgi:4-hydroxy-tetrahydrodipicolinate reductase
MIKVGVTGIGGRMGMLIARGVSDAPEMELAGALEISGHRLIGEDAGLAVGRSRCGFIVSDNPQTAFKNSDVIIDFTVPETTLNMIEIASENKKAMVIGTTGFSDAQKVQLMNYGTKVPFVFSPNMSIGVNVMFKIVEDLTRLLGDAYDIEIVEAHHRMKKDAPSGTALGLAQAAAKAREVSLKDKARYERYGLIGERPNGEIGIQTVRAGDIVGDHTVYFAGNGERIEFKHQAHSRENFARGAIAAARWIAGKAPGAYTMIDVLELDKRS